MAAKLSFQFNLEFTGIILINELETIDLYTTGMRSFRRYKIKYECNCTQQKLHNLFKAVKNSIEQCFAAHIFQCCQQYCSALLHLNVG